MPTSFTVRTEPSRTLFRIITRTGEDITWDLADWTWDVETRTWAEMGRDATTYTTRTEP